MKLAYLFALAALAAPAASADPCEAKLPTKAGTIFSGAVPYVVDGDGFCIGNGSDGANWIEVRLVDFNAPELNTPEGKIAQEKLANALHGKQVTCTVTKGRNGKTTTYDRVLARCTVAGVSVGDLQRKAGVKEGGN